jgi:peptidoglycan/LPS O-acetylase OafA/YrhL
MDQKVQKSIYFPNLNSIRFIAALLVIIHHIEQNKSVLNIYPNMMSNPMINYFGPLGVRLFFVLSGFLITYLLFAEKAVSGTISIKKFYIRRALRIWPLYYLIVLLAFFVVPHFFPMLEPARAAFVHGHPIAWKIFSVSLFIFFLPNFALVYIGIVPFASHLWSIGTEEQFYFIWPVLMKFFKNKFVLLLSVILCYLGATYIFYRFEGTTIDWIRILGRYWKEFPIDNMAIGGIFALIVYSSSAAFQRVKAFIFNRYFQVFILALLLVCIGISVMLPIDVLSYEFYAVLFGILIANLASNNQRIINLEYPLFNYLGKISYGLYMYHPLMIVICIKVLEHFNCLNNYWLYPASILGTILIAGLSYRFFEQQFIKKKKSYSTVISGDNTANVQ